ncbi:MAG: hypothetical protein ABSF38_20520 [Verrucomicrobiota bacterium]|jgi:hypothetical protein
MNSHSYLPSFRLGGTSFLLAALCSLSLAGQTATADIAGSGVPTAQPSAPTQSSQFEQRLAAEGKTPRSTLPSDSEEAGMLREAYARLAIADHDYKGHRVRAMAQVSAAAKALGVDLKGDGRGHEFQGVSDAHLRAAQGLLEQIAGGVTGPGLKHIRLAIEQIGVALAIR